MTTYEAIATFSPAHWNSVCRQIIPAVVTVEVTLSETEFSSSREYAELLLGMDCETIADGVKKGVAFVIERLKARGLTGTLKVRDLTRR